MFKKKIIALVCCRKNSKGIINKNIKTFSGKPLMYWTYKNIYNSKLFDEIYLSTDSKKFAEIGKNIGFNVPHLRPGNLAKSNSDVFETHKYFFKKMKIKDQNSYICIINNNPFIKTDLIKKSFRVFKKNKFGHIVMGAIPVESDQIFFRQMERKKNTLYPKFGRALIGSKINRQNHKTYYNIGDLRWGKPSWLTNYKNFNKKICKNGFKYFEVNRLKYQDINTLSDWKQALVKFKNI